MLSTAASYSLITKNLDKTLSQTAKSPMVEREAAYYLSKIRDIKTIDDFLGNKRIYDFAMTAFGLDEMIYAKAFMRKVLTEGVDSSTSFANKLSDPRFKEFTTAFNFVRYGATATAFNRTQQGTVDRYVRQTMEKDAGASNEGVRLALYFQRTAPNVKSTLGLLADKALLKVTQVALGLPESSGLLSLDKQVALIEKKLVVADLKDPTKLEKLLTRFTSLWDIENPNAAQPGTVPTVLAGTASPALDIDTLTRLQNLRNQR